MRTTTMRARRRAKVATQLRWTQWVAELQAELDEADEPRTPACCGSCGADMDLWDSPICWYCGEEQ